MIHIEVIGLDPPCNKCNELLENAKKAVGQTGIEATVEKKWTLSEEIREQYGLLLSPVKLIKVIGLLILLAATPAEAANEKISVETLNVINMQLNKFDSPSVIVELDSPDFRNALSVPELSDSARAGAIRSVITALRVSLSSELQHRIRHEYQFLPAVVISVDSETIEKLQENPFVKAIYPNELRKPTLLESVNLVFQNHASSSHNGNNQWAVAVLDTGVDKNHSFLKTNGVNKVISEACYSGGDIVGPRIDPLCPGNARATTNIGSGLNCTGYEGCDHGTHVAGIAAGDRDGSYQDGVASKGKTISIQVFTGIHDSVFCGGSPTCIGAFDSDILKGLERVYALRNTYKIAAVNLSLGGGHYQGNCNSENPLFTNAINNLRNVKIPTVIASGNEYYANAVSFPACISSAITVGASYDEGANIDKETYYSNESALLDLYAPGSYINSSVPGGGFSVFEGTSMAAPHVAGAFAVLRHAKPSATVNNLESVLKSVGPIVTSYSGYKRRRLDVKSALNKIASPPPPSENIGFLPSIYHLLLLDD